MSPSLRSSFSTKRCTTSWPTRSLIVAWEVEVSLYWEASLLTLFTWYSSVSNGGRYPGRERRSMRSTEASAPSKKYPLRSSCLTVSIVWRYTFWISSSVLYFLSDVISLLSLSRASSMSPPLLSVCVIVFELLAFPIRSGSILFLAISRYPPPGKHSLALFWVEPTKACRMWLGWFACSSTYRDSVVSCASEASLRPSWFISMHSVGKIDIRFAFPVLSPNPFTVPWITDAPPRTAAMLFDTAMPWSLWQWIPILVSG
mmetsp:Transcript_40607/g.95402  ORF Transcript_40607/g.95402 Transcript_40607/m.95402 type:complete len:258 (+) Transcript_40607:413-1186(+)